MTWVSKYVGIPFVDGGRTFGGCDCGGLVLLVLREEKGIFAKDFDEYTSEDMRSFAGMGKIGAGIEAVVEEEWVAAERPRPFDLARFRYGREPSHVGLYIGNGRFLHVERAGGFSRTCSMKDLAWGPRFLEFRRHRKLMRITQ